MTNQTPYISRKVDRELQLALDKALAQPSSNPVLFYVWGIGGVGKSNLTEKLQEINKDKVCFIKVEFDKDDGIKTPISLMKKLYDNLEKPISPMHRDIRELPSVLQSDPFVDLYEKYDTTLKNLQNDPIDSKKAGEPDKKNALNEIAKAAIGSALPTLVTTHLGIPLDPEGAGKIATVALSAKDLLMQHQATKKKKALIELMENPLPKLTKAFIEGLNQRSKALKKPIILVLDTYEKAEANCQGVDTWLWRTLLNINTDIKNHSIRIVMAGRGELPHLGWSKVSSLIYPCNLERFDLEQTREYLQKWEISSEPESIFRLTRGLPKYLQWIREMQVRGINIDFSKGSKKIASLLLEDLTSSQKHIVKLAAFCHWFDKPLIDHLIKSQNIPFDSEADKNCNWFEWLTKTHFVELVKGKYRFDDVARDVFRQQVYLEDSKQFDDIHYSLSLYFKVQANCEITSDCSPPNKYNNDDWCKCIAESLYHALFSKQGDNQLDFLSHLFASLYCNRNDLSAGVVEMVVSEIDLNSDDFQDSLLSKATKDFLKTIAPIAKYGLTILSIDKIDFNILKEENISQYHIDKALEISFNKLNQVHGLAKYVILLYKSKRGSMIQSLDCLNKARSLVDIITTNKDSDFRFNLLLLSLGRAFYEQGFYNEALTSYEDAIKINANNDAAWVLRGLVLDKLNRHEEALISYENALKFNSSDYFIWLFRGNSLLNLGKCEDAFSSFEQSLTFNPDDYDALDGQGIALSRMGKHQEAIVIYDKALQINHNAHETWYGRGVELGKLGRYEESIMSFNEALRFKPDYIEALNGRGVGLYSLGQHEESLADFDRALEINPKNHKSYCNKACAYSLQNQIELALENLQKAIQLKPEENRKIAKTDSDFDNIRHDPRFQALIQ